MKSKLEQWQTELLEQEQHTEDVEPFICKYKQYTELAELTPTILNDLVGILPELNTPAHEEMA